MTAAVLEMPSSMSVEPEAKTWTEPTFASPRLQREWITISAMIHSYCRHNHAYSDSRLCSECQDLIEYAALRLTRCRFGAEKPTCANCPVHCYQPQRREQVRVVMRDAGPRMLWEHPILALRHWIDGRTQKQFEMKASKQVD